MRDSEDLRYFKIGFPIFLPIAIAFGVSSYWAGVMPTVLFIFAVLGLIAIGYLLYGLTCVTGCIFENVVKPWLRKWRGEK